MSIKIFKASINGTGHMSLKDAREAIGKLKWYDSKMRVSFNPKEKSPFLKLKTNLGNSVGSILKFLRKK